MTVVILDPNVLVSAVVASGVSAELLDRWLPDRSFELVVCPRVDQVEVPPVTRDPKDDYLVALHRRCQADLLVSGDFDLFALAAKDVTVLTPGDLLERLWP